MGWWANHFRIYLDMHLESNSPLIFLKVKYSLGVGRLPGFSGLLRDFITAMLRQLR
jgi:hypothetical protein